VVAGGAADLAGLKDGDVVDLPSCSEAVALDQGECLRAGVIREGVTTVRTIQLVGETAPVCQWQVRAGSRCT